MVFKYLQLSNDGVKQLIELTLEDINDIKSANHLGIKDRSFIKSELIEKFENNKANLDKELLTKVAGNKTIEEVLSQEEHTLLKDLRTNLEKLQKENKNFAKLVVAVNEFYNSMLGEMFPDKDGITSDNYGIKKVSPASLLEVSA